MTTQVRALPIKGIAAISDKLAQGDLTVKAEPRSPKDLLGNASKKLIENLKTLIVGISEGAGQVASGSGQVSSASQALSQGATEQASSLEEITSSMTEISAQTKTNAENATQASQLAKVARDAIMQKWDGEQKCSPSRSFSESYAGIPLFLKIYVQMINLRKVK